jgi:hypothetical protein
MDTKAEEFRFAKKQQWYVATAAVTLIAANFAVADKVHVTAFEKGVVVVALVAIAIFASWTLCSTQKYIVSMREKSDRQPRCRHHEGVGRGRVAERLRGRLSDCVATAILRLMENERAMADSLCNDPFSWNVCTSWLRTPNT